MWGTTVLWEAVVLVAAVAVFDLWERLRPARPHRRRPTLRLDLAALAIVVVFSQVWKTLLTGGLDALEVAAAFSPIAPLHEAPSALKVLLGLAAGDFCLYWVHRAMHASDLLFRTHAFHHTTEHLYWLSGSRTSVLHLLFFAGPQVLIAGYLLRFTPGEAAVALGTGVVVNLWVHSNVRVRLGPLEALLVTPDYHRVHHSADANSRKNLGFIFTVWDRLFGTHVDPRTLPDGFRLGMAEPRPRLLRRIVGV